MGKNYKSWTLQKQNGRDRLPRKQEGSVRTQMPNNFMGSDVDDMIFGSAEQIISER